MNFSSVNIYLTIGCVECPMSVQILHRHQIDTNSGRVNDLQDKYTFHLARPAGLVASNRFVEAWSFCFILWSKYRVCYGSERPGSGLTSCENLQLTVHQPICITPLDPSITSYIHLPAQRNPITNSMLSVHINQQLSSCINPSYIQVRD